MKQRAKDEGWWDGEQVFNWSVVIGVTASGDLENPDSRYSCGRNLLTKYSNNKSFTISNMMEVLRDEPSGINRPSGNFPTAGSQVSVLSCSSDKPDGHWFTATPHPSRSIFKPFQFGMICPLTEYTCSEAPSSKQRRHKLWWHQTQADVSHEKLAVLEAKYVQLGLASRDQRHEETNLFNEAVNEELALYA